MAPNIGPVEKQIGKIALTRKDAPCAGHEDDAEHRAPLASPIAKSKMCDVDPVSYVFAQGCKTLCGLTSCG